ncbi:non-ribosomal peptide synthetase [Naasia sp. SYSU D00948]|uniref:non-ribosomal peptide synthetase n=1 Tax=Naasia sp. SYSU D00948 TaxID=2817379 RepID=UPI001FEF3EF7|nr:non-ribosomal peptide synthetase [Naasia sp. SYSU D00948]
MTTGASLPATTVHLEHGLDLLGGAPDAVAVVTDDEALTYAELRRRLEDRARELGEGRRLVLIEAENALEPLVTYLAALSAGHVVLLVPAGGSKEVLDRYDPDVVEVAGVPAPKHRRDGSAHELHPDLALLLSTSGSTGSPKLVRLSRGNVASNAASIAEYLGITPADRAITTLPFSYCYGLSVIHSHLLAGAGLRLTTRSVIEPEFWHDFEAAGCTSFAGVPYTFELLDAAAFAERSLPTLRYITQAGGRMEPEQVREYARLGRRRGFELVVMYGQTEATARMAYLPPSLVEARAGTIGVPVPGGDLRVEDPGEDGVGQLVYRGPNVMMGYAEGPADLAAEAGPAVLRTGDLARRHDDGLFEVVGRVSRFVKVFGLRVDLDRVQRLLAEEDIDALALGIDERLVLAVRSAELVQPAEAAAARRLGLPPHAVEARLVPEFPRTASGKHDWAALAELVLAAAPAHPQASGGEVTAETLRRLYAELLELPSATLDDSFTSLGGDSLSYVEVSVRLEELLGELPQGWPAMSVRELAARTRPSPAPERRRRRWTARLETSLVLRAAAIVLVTATHANLLGVQGGAHLLLALLGLNLGRFQLTDAPRSARVRALLRTGANIAVPAVLWIGGVALVTGMYGPSTVFLVNDLLGGGDRWSVQWQYWFLEVAVWSIAGLALAAAVPALHRLERRRPFAVAVTAFGATLALRIATTGVEAGAVERYSLPAVAWLLALGWVIARSATWRTRLAASALAGVSVPGFFGDPGREAVVLTGLLLVVWVPTVPLPRLLVPAVRVVAAASLFVYLVHWQVYPWLEDDLPLLATLASFAAGIAAWRIHRLARSALARVIPTRNRSGPAALASPPKVL